ncbi:hypothetical protein MFUM_1050017 [Methylacidiphilum fumariolicum SolV]|uniref:Uncharacterized protein n=2 Tax=Candidatus Methylacidiphilum fumarolicum TaxID=591154 RepID=I0JW52_METFB|nr:conserved protein of unknown function [Candidatus Methylacidiphilum fumarolicum]CCG91471.1 hypothetical protein MFUM_1050017 [Methylacidiphilum fumariolicum SolV]
MTIALFITKKTKLYPKILFFFPFFISVFLKIQLNRKVPFFFFLKYNFTIKIEF